MNFCQVYLPVVQSKSLLLRFKHISMSSTLSGNEQQLVIILQVFEGYSFKRHSFNLLFKKKNHEFLHIFFTRSLNVFK